MENSESPSQALSNTNTSSLITTWSEGPTTLSVPETNTKTNHKNINKQHLRPEPPSRIVHHIKTQQKLDKIHKKQSSPPNLPKISSSQKDNQNVDNKNKASIAPDNPTPRTIPATLPILTIPTTRTTTISTSTSRPYTMRCKTFTISAKSAIKRQNINKQNGTNKTTKSNPVAVHKSTKPTHPNTRLFIPADASDHTLTPVRHEILNCNTFTKSLRPANLYTKAQTKPTNYTKIPQVHSGPQNDKNVSNESINPTRSKQTKNSRARPKNDYIVNFSFMSNASRQLINGTDTDTVDVQKGKKYGPTTITIKNSIPKTKNPKPQNPLRLNFL